ncbi:transglutaminase family protein [Nocardioides sp.]|uniref:transglutaminase family protein n=1 Tax=Nocardioides sp. TaxID=35761 RepID=UPI001A29394F|nr:transglutaminase family protein [Nocardioides sp.]MBJ7359743.1 transglutaminase family protein [Nocardioides sp.]
MTAYRITHRTTYSYDDEVTDSLGIAHLVPRALPGQAVASYDVAVTPAPVDLSHDTDYYGNLATYFQVTDPHTRLEIEAVSEVDVASPVVASGLLDVPWERARPLASPDLTGAWRATDFALPSTAVEQVEEARDYAGLSFTRHRPLGEAVTDLMHRIHADFDYDHTATTVTSTVAEVLSTRAGVCQDFAHLTLACLRSQGLAGRYVSGYLSTLPAPGRPRVVGADASHAWVAVWLPDLTGATEGDWLAFDPTNDQEADDRYVTVAWGRDYADVPPVKGVIFTEAKKSTLLVSVDVAPI